MQTDAFSHTTPANSSRPSRAAIRAEFDRLITRETGRFLAVALGVLRNSHDAEEAMQDAFISAWRSLEQFDGASRMSTWLHRIVVNAALMKRRAASRRPAVALSAAGVDPAERPCEPTDPLEADENRSSMTRIAGAMEDLPGRGRDVVELRLVRGVDTDATARLLGMSSSAVKTRLHRSVRALSQGLSPNTRRAA